MSNPDVEPNPTIVQAIERLHARDFDGAAALMVKAQREFVELATVYLTANNRAIRLAADIRQNVANLQRSLTQ